MLLAPLILCFWLKGLKDYYATGSGDEKRENPSLDREDQLVISYLTHINLIVVERHRDITLTPNLQIKYNAEYGPKVIYL
jgi:hypothetical protein